MFSLLRTEALEIVPQSATSGASPNQERSGSQLCAYTCQTENIHLALFTDSTLLLHVINTKHRLSPLSRTVDWTSSGYGPLLALVFDPSGSQLIAVSGKYLYVIPFQAYMRHNGRAVTGSKKDCVVEIKLPPLNRVSCCLWWQTALSKDIVIIGTEKGELAFIDMKEEKCVHRSRVNGHIIRLELVPDDRQHMTYLLISGRSSLQWRLLLDISDLDLHLTMSKEKMAVLGYLFYGGKTYIKSILHSKTQYSSDSEFQPRRFTNIPISVTLRYQNAKGCHLLSAMDRSDDSLQIYDSSMEHHPLFVYSLPFWCEYVVYTDRLIFCAVSRQHVIVVANQLSEKESSDNQGGHVIYKYMLDEDEDVRHMISIKFSRTWYSDLSAASSTCECQASKHTVLDGCLVITSRRLLEIRPNISPEQLFLNWTTESTESTETTESTESTESTAQTPETSNLETLARVTHIDILHLYLRCAEYHLMKKHESLALDYLSHSKCDEVVKISMLHKYKLHEFVIKLSSDILNSSKLHITSSVRKDLSEKVLDSYVNSTKAGLSSLQSFSEFLLYNTCYSLDSAMKLLCQQDLVCLLIELALARKFIHGALEHVFNEQKITPKVLHKFMIDKEFITALGAVAEGAIVYLLDPHDFCTYLLNTAEVRLAHLQWFSPKLDDVGPESLRLLAQRYHPYSNFTQMSVIVHKERLELASLQSYASLQQEPAGSEYTWPSPADFISSLYLFYVKLVLKLSSLEVHKCLLRPDLERLNVDADSATDGKTAHHTVLYGRKRGRPLCCYSAGVYSLHKNSLFTWGSRKELDGLSIEDRVKLSTPRIVDLSTVNSSDVKAISCGEKHLMMLCADGLYGSGSSEYGQVGAGGCTEYENPVKLSMNCVDVVCGRYHTMAIDKHGRVYSWGWGLFGQLGHDSINNESSPRVIDGLSGVFVTSVAAGHSHSLALSVQGQVWVFGSNAYGQIDDGQMITKVCTPTKLAMNGPVKHIATKYFHSVAVEESGAIVVWGMHPFVLRRKSLNLKSGGKSLTAVQSATMTKVWLGRRKIDRKHCLDTIVQVECGSAQALFLTDAGVVSVWEESLQQPKEATSADESSGEQVLKNAGPDDAVYIACGFGFFLALTASGSLHSWGKNDHGQLGLALRNIRHIPKPGEVKVATSYRVASTRDVYKMRLSECVECLQSARPSDDRTASRRCSAGGHDFDDNSWRDCDLLEFGKMSRLESFPLQQLLCLAIRSRAFTAVVSAFCATRSWNEACFYHLKALLLCQSHLGDDYCKRILEVMEFYLERIAEDAVGGTQDDLTHLLYRVLQFWQAKQLPVRPELEERLLAHLNEVSSPLCRLLLSQSPHAKLADELVSAFSSSFLAALTRSGMAHMSGQNTSDEKAAVWTGVVRTIRKSLFSRTSTTLTHFEIERLRSECDPGDSRSDIIAFTCGHHCSKQRFETKILQGFESRMLNKMPISGSNLLDRYRSGDFASLACPQCAYSSICMLVG